MVFDTWAYINVGNKLKQGGLAYNSFSVAILNVYSEKKGGGVTSPSFDAYAKNAFLSSYRVW